MEEYIVALFILFILHWYFNIRKVNNCIVLNNCNSKTKINKFIYEEFKNI